MTVAQQHSRLISRQRGIDFGDPTEELSTEATAYAEAVGTYMYHLGITQADEAFIPIVRLTFGDRSKRSSEIAFTEAFTAQLRARTIEGRTIVGRGQTPDAGQFNVVTMKTYGHTLVLGGNTYGYRQYTPDQLEETGVVIVREFITATNVAPRSQLPAGQ